MLQYLFIQIHIATIIIWIVKSANGLLPSVIDACLFFKIDDVRSRGLLVATGPAHARISALACKCVLAAVSHGRPAADMISDATARNGFICLRSRRRAEGRRDGSAPSRPRRAPQMESGAYPHMTPRPRPAQDDALTWSTDDQYSGNWVNTRDKISP